VGSLLSAAGEVSHKDAGNALLLVARHRVGDHLAAVQHRRLLVSQYLTHRSLITEE